jgi:mannose/fructose/N-acetylgalactosamine-specific phosphotransferase system component IIC
MGVLNKYNQLIKGILLSFRILIIFLCLYLIKENLIEFLLNYIPSWRSKYAYEITIL